MDNKRHYPIAYFSLHYKTIKHTGKQTRTTVLNDADLKGNMRGHPNPTLTDRISALTKLFSA